MRMGPSMAWICPLQPAQNDRAFHRPLRVMRILSTPDTRRADMLESSRPMFRIKICGITTVRDAVAAASAGADAIGLNFCAQSPRCVDLEIARQIVDAVPPQVAKVGVFVNESIERLTAVADALALDYLQLHGDEPLSHIGALAPRRVIRAFRLRDEFSPVTEWLEQCRRLGPLPAAVLVDAYDPGSYGGTGNTVKWGYMRALAERVGLVPLVLAGGLRPENVEEAIRESQLRSVDVASGVELAPGQKDEARMRQFVEAAQRVWGVWDLA